ADVLADDHALVDLLAGTDEQQAALLEVQQRELRGLAAAIGDERPRRPGPELAMPRLVPLAHVMELARAPCRGHELGPEPDHPTRRDDVPHPDPPGAVIDHLPHPPPPER